MSFCPLISGAKIRKNRRFSTDSLPVRSLCRQNDKYELLLCEICLRFSVCPWPVQTSMNCSVGSVFIEQTIKLLSFEKNWKYDLDGFLVYSMSKKVCNLRLCFFIFEVGKLPQAVCKNFMPMKNLYFLLLAGLL